MYVEVLTTKPSCHLGTPLFAAFRLLRGAAYQAIQTKKLKPTAHCADYTIRFKMPRLGRNFARSPACLLQYLVAWQCLLLTAAGVIGLECFRPARDECTSLAHLQCASTTANSPSQTKPHERKICSCCPCFSPYPFKPCYRHHVNLATYFHG